MPPRVSEAALLEREFLERYRAAGGAKESGIDAVREVFAAYEQAKVFAADFHKVFIAERQRGQELSDALARLQSSHAQLQESEERFRSLVLNSSDAILMVDGHGVVSYASPAVHRLWGFSPEEMTGRSFEAFLTTADIGRLRRAVADLAGKPGNVEILDLSVAHVDGTWRQLETVVANPLNTPGALGFVLNARDVTDRRELERQLAHQAFHDPLTGLPNRALFMDRLAHVLQRGLRTEVNIGVLLVDVDRFKGINDTLGHAAGDELLQQLSEHLVASVSGPGDTVARLGGDEFALLLEEVEKPQAVVRVAERIVAIGEQPIRLTSGDLPVTLSVGVAPLKGRVQPPEELLRAADIALYQAKNQGRGRYVVFDPAMDAVWVERLNLERDLRGAVERGEILNYYQPIIALGTGEVIGLEALARWQHPTRGIVTPSEFIGLAEEVGQIRRIDEHVLLEACRQVREWNARSGRPIFVSVNVSPIELRRPEYPDEVAAALDLSRLDPALLQLEITESVLMESGHPAIHRLSELKTLGVRLAIDDFGTGFSSLAYLAELPIDTLKIDRSFVARLAGDEKTRSIVAAVLMMAGGLGIDVTAEGIETEAQERQLIELGCGHGQGFRFARPAAARGIRGAITALPRPGSRSVA